jgi:hypothetical protein
MAGEVLLINPRRRRRRRKARVRNARRRSTHRRRRRNPFILNAHRRRRRVGRRHRRVNARRHRRVRRNPRLPLLGNVNVGAIGAGAVGFVGTRYGTTWLLSMLPAAWQADPNTAPLVRIGTKAVIGLVALPMLARAMRWRGAAGPLAIGGGIAVAVDIFQTYLEKMLPLPVGVTSLADYEQGYITSYEPGQLTGEPAMDFSGGGAYGGGAY